jgi:amino-acid N-acetyltransferase
MRVEITRAAPQDLDAVLRLLAEVDLPAEGVSEHFGAFFVAREGETVVGCVGEERYGDVSLLRSLAVSPSSQRTGLGKALTAHLLEEALRNGVSEEVLLTTTAADFFARHFGFAQSERKRFDEVFATSPEWRLPRCSSAVCMSLRLSK